MGDFFGRLILKISSYLIAILGVFCLYLFLTGMTKSESSYEDFLLEGACRSSNSSNACSVSERVPMEAKRFIRGGVRSSDTILIALNPGTANAFEIEAGVDKIDWALFEVARLIDVTYFKGSAVTVQLDDKKFLTSQHPTILRNSNRVLGEMGLLLTMLGVWAIWYTREIRLFF